MPEGLCVCMGVLHACVHVDACAHVDACVHVEPSVSGVHAHMRDRCKWWESVLSSRYVASGCTIMWPARCGELGAGCGGRVTVFQGQEARRHKSMCRSITLVPVSPVVNHTLDD